MKKFILLVGLICYFGSASAQTKTAYCDVYARGGGLNLKVTISFDSDSYNYVGRKNIGEVLNDLSSDGWVLDSNIVIPRHPLYSLFTRHKLHFIMKKEYQEGEDPFKYLKVSCPNIIEYKGLEVIKVDVDNNSAILFAVHGKTGTWNEAMEYCKSLGEEWRLPSAMELYNIKTILKDNEYWTCEEISDKKAKYYDKASHTLFSTSKSTHRYIQPIAVVDTNELE